MRESNTGANFIFNNSEARDKYVQDIARTTVQFLHGDLRFEKKKKNYEECESGVGPCLLDDSGSCFRERREAGGEMRQTVTGWEEELE